MTIHYTKNRKRFGFKDKETEYLYYVDFLRYTGLHTVLCFITVKDPKFRKVFCGNVEIPFIDGELSKYQIIAAVKNQVLQDFKHYYWNA